MPRGIPKDWTLDELNLVWNHDGLDGTTVDDHMATLGVTRATWYSLKARLRNAGGPDELYAAMQESKKGRYNRASDPKTRSGKKPGPETLGEALGRVYTLRGGAAGRDGTTVQYTVTVPPVLAKPFVEKYGRSIRFEPREDGILIRPVSVDVPESLPDWMRVDEESAE